MRSSCPVACALDILGDKWTLLIIRDLLSGFTRFKEFAEGPEGIPTNILSDRLERLCDQGVVKKVPVSEGAKRFAYQLTPKGKELKKILLPLARWGMKHLPGTAMNRSSSSG